MKKQPLVSVIVPVVFVLSFFKTSEFKYIIGLMKDTLKRFKTKEAK